MEPKGRCAKLENILCLSVSLANKSFPFPSESYVVVLWNRRYTWDNSSHWQEVLVAWFLLFEVYEVVEQRDIEK